MYLKELAKEYLASRRERKASPKYQLEKGEKKVKNIIFILPTNKTYRAGGDKVIYNQSQMINDTKLNGFTSQVLHPFDLNTHLNWFDHNVSFKKDLSFDPEKDFVVVPEFWAVPHSNLLASLGVRYAIYVQGGYIMNIPLSIWTREQLESAYQNASLLMAISADTAENISLAFPDESHKVIRNYCSVDAGKFSSGGQKEKLITYMPRKLAKHSDLVKFFLESKLPTGWQFQAVEGLDEQGVADLFGKSSIFLSFGELEGFGLPPLEAAIAGNHVIGYTAQAAKEYWDPAIFTEIQNGDIKHFCNAIVQKISQIESDEIDSAAFEKARESLVKRYSRENETKALEKMTQKIDTLMQLS